jgi:pimeloyl-ACP methyl ester carboxylesterase
MDHARTFVTADGVRLAYRLWRPGPPRQTLVLIHGLASNHTRWSELVATTSLRASWDLLRPDLRGFGQSIARTQVGLEVWSRDLGAVLIAEQAAPAVIVGHCLGANVALVLAARCPAAAHRLVLIEPMFREALTGGLRLAARLRPLAAVVAVWARTLNAVGVYRRCLPPLDLEQLDREARAAMAAGGPSAFPEARYGSILEDLTYTPTAVYLDGLRAVTGPLPDLKTIAAPTLSLLSTGGRFGDPAITARLLGELRRGEVRMLEARHWIPTESPVQMRQAIEEWCERT